jgi:lipopolysaccharide/colanic/teichoic acid biosynthesis glycosyltransferase
MKRSLVFLFFDALFVILAYLFYLWFKEAPKTILKNSFDSFLIFLSLWLIAGSATRKYSYKNLLNFPRIAGIILISNLSVTIILSLLMFLFTQFEISRVLVFVTIILVTVLEIIGAGLIDMLINTPVIEMENGNSLYGINQKKGSLKKAGDRRNRKSFQNATKTYSIAAEILNIIESDNGPEVRHFVEDSIKLSNGYVKVVSTTTRFNIQSLSGNDYGCIINLQCINNIQYINKFFESVNFKLINNGIFIGKAETFSLRKKRILKNIVFPLNYIVYTIDFLFKRVIPKIPVLKKVYFWITHGKNRLLSRAETLGRLYSCGFEVLDEKFFNNELYFVVRKIEEPHFPSSPTYGPLIKLNRIGKGGKVFRVYKMRTMHPYAEYLQPYIFRKYNLQNGGKFKDDFRVNTLGRAMRKVWIDEFPMLINILKGEMKIVGVRPLSKHYYSLYSKELQEKRVKFKPGLIPPFYADMPETLEEIMDSEMRYLNEYEKSPIKTDLRYFIAAWKNIIFKKARSN